MSAAGEHRPSERGAALVFVLLLMLALAALAQASLAASLGELVASRAVVRHMEARAAAEGVVASFLRRTPPPWMDSLPTGAARAADTLALGGAAGIGTVRRLGVEAWLVEGTGRVGARATARHGLLAWSMDPLARVRAIGGALTAGATAPLALAGVVDATDPARVDPPLDSLDCASWLSELTAHYAAAPLAPAATVVDTTGGPRLGLVEFRELLAASQVTLAGAGTPAPQDWLGVCRIDQPWVWGDPDQPGAPCGPHLPLRAALGDLTVTGGVGQGILVVEGDLVLTAGARYYGLVLTRGALRVEGGAVLEGLAVAHGGAVVSVDSRVVASACRVVRALAWNRAALGSLRAVPGVGSIGPL